VVKKEDIVVGAKFNCGYSSDYATQEIVKVLYVGKQYVIFTDSKGVEHFNFTEDAATLWRPFCKIPTTKSIGNTQVNYDATGKDDRIVLQRDGGTVALPASELQGVSNQLAALVAVYGGN